MSIAVDGAAADFLSIVFVEYRSGIAPAHEVEEALALHSQLQAAFRLHHLDGILLRVVALVVGHIHLHTVRVLIAVDHLGAAGSACAELVDNLDGLVDSAQLGISLGTHQQHVGIAEHDAIHRACPVAALDEVFADEGWVDILLQ